MTDVVPLLKHTPSAQRPEILEAITVQREPLVAALVEAALDTRGGLRHRLLVGPRGIGKTHILSLVASRVRVADPDASRVVVAWLDEDPWGVRTYGKFLAAIAARVGEALGDAELEHAASVLRAAGPSEDGLACEELVRRAVGRRRLVLLVENLDEIFRRIETEGQLRFRAFAEDWGQMLLLATTPQLFAGVRQHASPFYGFFAVDHLDELSLESATDLLKRIARLRDNERLLRFLATDVAVRRLRAIEALAGGHPRVWLLLAGCISVPAIDKLVPLFMEALDDLTPYYQARLQELGDQQQEIVVLLCEAGGALSNRALAERSGIPERQVATILRQLSDRGYVRRATLPEDVSGGDKRMSFWELREPLMRLSLDVKQTRGEPLRVVVAFLRAWYGSRLLDELIELPAEAELAAVYVSEAFRTLDASLLNEELMDGTPEQILARAERGLSLRPDDEALGHVKASALLMLGRRKEACDLLESLIARASSLDAVVAASVQLANGRRALGEPIDAERLLADARELATRHPDSPSAAAQAARAYHLVGACDEAALAVYARAVELNPEVADLQGALGSALAFAGRFEEAADVFARAVELRPDNASHHRRRGIALSAAGRFEEALTSLARAVAMEPSRGLYQASLAVGMIQAGRYGDALGPAAKAVALEPASADYHDLHGTTLEALGHAEDALRAYRRAAELEPETAHHHASIATALRKLGRPTEAEAAARRAVALEEGKPRFRFVLAEALLAQGAVERALDAVREALAVAGETYEHPVGETLAMCVILWDSFRAGPERARLISQIGEAYRDAGVEEQLGRGIVASIGLLLADRVAQDDADAWLEEWTQASLAENDIPLRMLRAATAWKRDRDERHLLALPLEQREIVLGMVPR